jgi:hypothetical protein
MKWRGNRKSNYIDDHRGQRLSGMGRSRGGLIRLLPAIIRFLGIKGTLIVAIGVLGLAVFTGNTHTLLTFLGFSSPYSTTSVPIKQSASENELVDFVSVILADTEDTWTALFAAQGMQYTPPTLVLFRGAVNSACGMGQSAMGPFYCPADKQVYIDLSFYQQLKTQFNAPGDFAQAYVIAHEVGHHIQTLQGISQKVYAARRELSRSEGNTLSVKQELQADCLAGVWAHHAHKARQLLEAGDVEEGLQAASAIGDDTLQKQSSGHVSPDSFTHGSSAQRVRWFKRGLELGDMKKCDTFSAPKL